MSQFIEPIAFRHYSKRSVFRTECGACGKPLHRKERNKIGYLCKKCGLPRKKDGNEKIDDISMVCYYCPFEMECSMRVQLGIWVRCETPDIADLERLRYSGGLNDEEVRAELDNAMAKRGNRKILEKAISKSAPKIYKNVIDGKKGQIPNGI